MVNEVFQEMIFDFKDLVNHQQWTFDVNRKKIPWSKIEEIHVDSQIPDFVQFKLTLLEDYYEINLKKKKAINLETHQLKPAYTQNLGIPTAKLKDLHFLCQKMLSIHQPMSIFIL